MAKIEMSLVMESGWFEEKQIGPKTKEISINARLENDENLAISYNAHLKISQTEVLDKYRNEQPSFKEKVDYFICPSDDVPNDGKLYMKSKLRSFFVDNDRLHLVFDIYNETGTECLDVWMDKNPNEEIRRKLSCGSIWWIAKIRHDK